MKQESILMYGTAPVQAFPGTEHIRSREDDGFDKDNDGEDDDKEQQEYNTPRPDISRDQPKAK
jgi:hypothetical protein